LRIVFRYTNISLAGEIKLVPQMLHSMRLQSGKRSALLAKFFRVHQPVSLLD